MDTRELARIDLNLLISLQVLLEEGSVSRAAERLFITQPAMSKTLSRLRHLFGDQLFTRTRHGMQPTPRAEQLVSGLAEVLGDIGQLLAQPGFDPHSFKGEITLAHRRGAPAPAHATSGLAVATTQSARDHAG